MPLESDLLMARARVDRTCTPAHLRVYSGDESPAAPSVPADPRGPEILGRHDGQAHGDMRLSELYRWALASGLLPSSPRNHEQLAQSVTLFERLCAAPPLRVIDRPILSSFVAELQKQPGKKRGSTMAVNTVLKHYRTVASLLNLAVEERVIDGWRAPRQLPTPDDPEPRVVPPMDIERIVAAMSVARLPQLPGIAPSEWWFALISYLYYTGVRIGHARKLTWSLVHLDQGFVQATNAIQKTKKRKRVYLHGDLVAILRDFGKKRYWSLQVECKSPIESAALAAHRELVFPWFAGAPAKGRKVRALTNVWLYREWARIQEAAGVTPDPVDGWYGFHDLRRTLGSTIADSHGEQVAADVLGHTVAVLRKHYDAGRTAREAKAVQSLPSMPGAAKRGRPARERTAFLPGLSPDD